MPHKENLACRLALTLAWRVSVWAGVAESGLVCARAACGMEEARREAKRGGEET